jgi:2-desacetyl-2-hydroxyethyl bacteriochlorophyllide A dehydrogenase
MENYAIKVEKPHEIRLVQLEMPAPQKDEALIRVIYAGVCGSDFKVYLGKMNNVTYPIIGGHEFSGEIIEVGENSAGLKPGMIVTSTPYYGCGTCYCCKKGWFNCCQNNKTMGVGRDGGFRNYICIPISKICNGKGIPARTLAMIEPFANSLNLVKRIDPQAGETMLIFGSGPIGVFAMLAAKQRGAVVHLADVSEERLAFARRMGADGTVNLAQKDLREYVREQTGDEGFNITVEAVGSGDVFKQCIDTVSFHGRVCVIGMTTTDYTFNHSIISYKEIRLVGARNSTRADFLDLIDMVSSGVISPDIVNRMATKEYSFRDAAMMFKELETIYTENMKVLINFQQ